VVEKCSDCGETLPAAERSCVVCGKDAGFPNVRRANRTEEVDALRQRKDDAYAASKLRGDDGKLREFELTVQSSKAVMNRSLGALDNWVQEATPLFVAFHKHVRSGARVVLSDDQWDELRIAAESTVNPFYFEDLNISALAIDGIGMPHYGPYSVTLKSSLIQARSSVFEENPFLFHRRHFVMAGDKCPPGYRAEWSRRSDLAVAKLHAKVTKDIALHQFPGILLEIASAGTGNDDFVEVHTYGPLHHLTIEHVRGPKPKDRYDRALWKKVQKRLTKLGATWDEV